MSNQPTMNEPAQGDGEQLLEQFLHILAGIAARLSTPAASEPEQNTVQSAKKAA